MTRPASYGLVWGEDATSDQMGGETATADQNVIEVGWVGSATAEPPTARMQNYWQTRVDLGLQEIERQGFLSWRSDVPYQVAAIVTYAGYLFQAISTNTGITPQGANDDGVWSFIQPGKWPTTTDNILGVLPISKGGTGANDPEDARDNLGLGTAATYQVGTTQGQVPAYGAGGILVVAPAILPGQAMQLSQAVGRLIGLRVFTASATYTPTPGAKSIRIRLIAGGGAGGGAAVTNSAQIAAGAGGCAGSYAEGYFTSLAASYAVTVGAGGVPVSGNAGGNGGVSSVGTIISATGGTGGGQFGPTSAPLTALTNPTATSIIGANIVGIISNTPPMVSIASLTVGYAGQGANSPLGAGGASTNTSSNGNAGSSYGAGGGGALALASSAIRTGGAGSPGIVIIEEFS
ncbi:hypothetical protein [Pseudomonas sp. dw_358]|uniref:glycine-rich domain-containing protein n=1 Tax=Pseudomonas sp. dw_358 TaxID=2720083 RepID=UPI001BD2625C|nr:hypothetical protein [Pseudomonas sp. dw_358]